MNKVYNTINPNNQITPSTKNSDQIKFNCIKIYQPFIVATNLSCCEAAVNSNNNTSENKINNLNQISSNNTLLTKNSYNLLQVPTQKVITEQKNNILTSYSSFLQASKKKDGNVSKILFIRLKNSFANKLQKNKIQKDNIFNYLKSLTSYSPFLRKRGISIKYLQNKSYFFNKRPNVNFNFNVQSVNLNQNNSFPIKTKIQGSSSEVRAITNINNINQTNIIKLLKYFFKSIYCIISKPVFLITPDRIIIQLFYYLNIPKNKKFKCFSIFYNKNIKKYYILLNRHLRKKLKFRKFKLGFFNRLNVKNRYFRFRFKKAIFKLKKRYFKLNNNISKNFIFNLFKNNLNKIYQAKFKIICDILSNKFNKPVELHLTRLHYPYHDSNILVNLLAMNLKNKKKKARILIKKIHKKRSIKNLSLKNQFSNVGSVNTLTKTNKFNSIQPINNRFNIAFLSGLNFKIAGRLMREPIIPRVTTKVFEKGAIAPGKVNFIDSSSITNKNKKGAFTIKITSGQNFYI